MAEELEKQAAEEQTTETRTTDPQTAEDRTADSGGVPARFGCLARLARRMKRHGGLSLQVSDTSVGVRVSADEKAVRRLNRALQSFAAGRFARGVAAGVVLGILLAYFVLPSLSAYIYTSKKGYLPPEYDALLKTKNVNEQAVQILEHTFPAHEKGVFGGKRVYFEAPVDDSSTIRLTYNTDRKGLVMSVSQNVGSRMVGGMVKKQVVKAGIDTSLSEGVGDALQRTTSMSVEKGYRFEPVLTIATRVDGREAEFVNRCEDGRGHHREFSAHDADSSKVRNGDHTVARRGARIPTPEDQMRYNALVRAFVNAYHAGEYRE